MTHKKENDESGLSASIGVESQMGKVILEPLSSNNNSYNPEVPKEVEIFPAYNRYCDELFINGYNFIQGGKEAYINYLLKYYPLRKSKIPKGLIRRCERLKEKIWIQQVGNYAEEYMVVRSHLLQVIRQRLRKQARGKK